MNTSIDNVGDSIINIVNSVTPVKNAEHANVIDSAIMADTVASAINATITYNYTA